MSTKPDFPNLRAPIYRVFHISPMGKIAGPPGFIEAMNDDDALNQVRSLVDGHAVELWDRDRLIARIDPVNRDPPE